MMRLLKPTPLPIILPRHLQGPYLAVFLTFDWLRLRILDGRR